MAWTKDVLKEGTGTATPQKGQKVQVHYEGTLKSNGAEFDSSYRRNKPFEFTIGVGQVIKGWDEGVASMKEGEEAVLHITSDYAYGPRAVGNIIPANSDLDFKVKLIKFA